MFLIRLTHIAKIVPNSDNCCKFEANNNRIDMDQALVFLLRIALAAVLGGIVGFEREYHAKDAGIRTHSLVALGSALLMIISQYAFIGSGDFDASRVAAQVVSGIGFIGAGIIIFKRNSVKGLTTAAGLWVSSGVGLAAGAGMYLLATVSTLIVIIILEAFNSEAHGIGEKMFSMTVSSEDSHKITTMLNVLKDKRLDASLQSLSRKDGKYFATIEVKVRRRQYEKELYSLLENYEAVTIEEID
jgi:putative Mg2+ transporter-C (MgtC) family protein